MNDAETANPLNEDRRAPQGHAEAELREAKRALEIRTQELGAYVSLLTATLESINDGTAAFDLSGLVVCYNSKFVEAWRFPADLLQRRDSHELMAYATRQVKDKDKEKFVSLVEQPRAATEAYDVVELNDGRLFESHSVPQLVDGQCIGVVVNFRDITDRRRAEQAMAVFAAIVDSSNDAIVSKTMQGIITSWNRGAERIFGYSADEMIGQPILKIIPPERADEEPQILARQARGEGIDHFETVRVRKDGQRIDVSVTLSPIKDERGNQVGISKIARDITERKIVELERSQLLSREQEARQEAERLNRTKDEFLATLSHELRTPLTAIIGWCSIVGDAQLDENERLRGLEIIRRNANVQTQLIEDILDVSRIVTGKLRLDVHPLDLSTIIEAAVEAVLPAAAAKEIRLQRVLDSGDTLVSGDLNRLQQVVWNLLSNAVKFTPKGGRVQVRLERNNSHVEIVVTDSGIGISPEVLPHVFERFRQADQSSTRNYGGLGLGLAIVRHIVEMHGGTVEADSHGEGQGASFTVKLPVMTAHTLEIVPEQVGEGEPSVEASSVGSSPFYAECPAELRGVHVLVVDDEEDTRQVIKAILERCEARVTTVSNVADALTQLQSLRPDVLVSDIGMPGEDGYTLIRKLRALAADQGGRTPAAALTAYARVEDRLQALRAGFQIHLAKPIEPIELVTVVSNLASHARD